MKPDILDRLLPWMIVYLFAWIILISAVVLGALAWSAFMALTP